MDFTLDHFEMGTNESNNSCLPEDESLSREQYRIIGISGAVASSVSILACITVIIIMIVFKKYMFAIQRLIIYITISVLLNCINQLMQRAAFETIATETLYCSILGFFSQYSSWCILVSINCALIELIMRIVFRREGGRFEILYVMAIFVLPAAINWAPFLFNGYGEAYKYCSIPLTRHCKKDMKNLIVLIVLWWVPLYGTIIFGGLSYVLMFCSIKREKKAYTAMIEVNRKTISERTLEEVGFYKWLPLLYVIIDIVPFATNIYDFVYPRHIIVELWVASAIIRGLQGGLISLVITLDSKTRKRLTWKHMCSAFISNILMKEDIEEYPILQDGVSDSLMISSKSSLNTTTTLPKVV